MELITNEQKAKLLENGILENRDKDHYPVVKLHTHGHLAVFLLLDIDPEDRDFVFSLSYLGIGFPEFKYVSLKAIELNQQAGLRIEQDFSFKAKYPISVYATAARRCGLITEDHEILSTIAKEQKDMIFTATDLVVELDIKPSLQMLFENKASLTLPDYDLEKLNRQQKETEEFFAEIANFHAASTYKPS